MLNENNMKKNSTNKRHDTDELAEGVPYEKGREFEEQFAKFMKKELAWNDVRIGAHMPGKNNAKGTTIDVFGHRLDELGAKYKDVAIKWMIVSGALMILSGIFWLKQWGEHGHWFVLFSLLS